MNFAVYSKEDCPYCSKVKMALELTGNQFVVYNLNEHFTKDEFYAEFIELARSVYMTNDERSNIKKEINIVCNSDYYEVKLY